MRSVTLAITWTPTCLLPSGGWRRPRIVQVLDQDQVVSLALNPCPTRKVPPAASLTGVPGTTSMSSSPTPISTIPWKTTPFRKSLRVGDLTVSRPALSNLDRQMILKRPTERPIQEVNVHVPSYLSVPESPSLSSLSSAPLSHNSRLNPRRLHQHCIDPRRRHLRLI